MRKSRFTEEQMVSVRPPVRARGGLPRARRSREVPAIMPKPRTSSRATPTIPPASLRRWREKDARHVLKAWRRSGLSGHAFAQSIGVDVQRLLSWRKRLKPPGADVSTPTDAAPPAALTFIPATLVSPASVAAVTIRLSGGVCVEVGDPAAVPASWLGAHVAELGKVPS